MSRRTGTGTNKSQGMSWTGFCVSTHKRATWNTMRPNGDALYVIGLGTGAYMATVFSLLYSSVFTAFAAAGSFDVEAQLLTLIGSLPSDGDPFIPKGKTPIPAWILDENGSGRAVADYLIRACGAKVENLRNDVAEVWRETPKPGTLYLNEQPVTEVWYTDEKTLKTQSQEELTEHMLAFVTRL